MMDTYLMYWLMGTVFWNHKALVILAGGLWPLTILLFVWNWEQGE